MNLYHPIHQLTETHLVKAGISLRSGGVSKPPYETLNLANHVGDHPAAVSQNQQIFSDQTGIKTLKYCKQIHSDVVINANSIPNSLWNVGEQSGSAKTGDAIISAHSDVALGIFTADCVPVFILDVAAPAVGIAHAGWRGTLARIATKTLAQMKATFGTMPDNCLVHIGPSIQKCCYTVSTELLIQFEQQFGRTVHNGNCLCLQTANVKQLMDAGVPSDSISISPFCTACSTDNFYSYRAEGGQTGRMLSFIQLIEQN